MTDDTHLFSLVRGGDRNAFDKLFRRWYAPMVSYALQFVPLAEAENVVQDVMFALWKNALAIELRSGLASYLYSSVKNRCLNVIDRKALYERYNSSVRASVADAVTDRELYSVRELGARLSKALGELTPEQRSAFEKSRRDGLKYEQIASEEGVSVKTVEYRISQALKKLRLALADYLQT
ncbi:MAG: RNA polymerase sigma-70 factor [Bacteroidales bacterium]|nr:RNA polymerase sigma-70 factor [Bacteroidales bacterium]